MNIPAERRKWLADRLRKIAAEEEAAGAKDIAAGFRQRTREVEFGANVPGNERMRDEPEGSDRT